MTFDDEAAFVAELTETGEDRVRANIAGGWYTERKRGLAEYWLSGLDRTRSDALAAQNLKVSRSAQVAAWIAAVTGILALAVSTAALWLALGDA